MAPFGASRAGLMSVAVDDIPDSVVVRNLMDEGSGTTAADAIGSNDLSLSGPTWQSGIGNGDFYLDFDGSDDEADWQSVPRSGSENRTLAMWVRLGANSLDDTVFFWGNGTDTTGGRWSLRNESDGNALRLDIGDANYETNLEPPTDETWFPVGVALDGDQLGDHLFYLDGQTEEASGSESVNTGTNEAGLGYDATLDIGHIDMDVDDPIWADTGWSKEEFDQWVSATEDNYS